MMAKIARASEDCECAGSSLFLFISGTGKLSFLKTPNSQFDGKPARNIALGAAAVLKPSGRVSREISCAPFAGEGRRCRSESN
jgi:hypothetical protein